MTFLWALVVSLLMLVGVQADDMAERSRLQGFLSKYFIAAASDRTATIRHNRPTHAASQEQSASISFESATMEWPNTKERARAQNWRALFLHICNLGYYRSCELSVARQASDVPILVKVSFCSHACR